VAGTGGPGGAGETVYGPDKGRGGAGGDVGFAGQAGWGTLPDGFTIVAGLGHAGGAAGYSIDGVGYVTTGTWDGEAFTPGALGGDLRGPQI
jgi:hypothetical protein